MGLALLVLWVGALQVMLDKGKELDWFASGQIVLLAVVSAVGFLYFVVWETTHAHPVVELKLFARRNFAIGSLTLAVAYCLFFGNVVLLPLWLQQYMGYTATAAGMALAPVGLFAIVLSPLVGRMVGKVDARWMTTTSFLVFALVLWMRAGFTPQADEFTILVPTLIQGCAVAFFFIPLMSITMSGIPPAGIAAASGLSNFARITAGAFGTSIATTVWESRAALHHTHLAERLAGNDPVLVDTLGRLAAAGLSRDQAMAQLTRMIDQQAFTRAADDVFLASSVLFVLLTGLIWLSRRPPRAGRAAADAGAH
jgi:MFS transporter, DHA2 family, multidrug resistance protein